MQTLSNAKLGEFLGALAAAATVYVPATVDGIKQYVPWREGVTPELLGPNTVLSVKGLFFPQTEEMYRYSARGLDLSIEETLPPEGKRVVVGVRGCDLQAVRCLDDVFLTRGFVDKFYALRRQNTVLVGLACLKPGPTCFCDSMGVTPGAPEGADVLMWPQESGFVLEARTPAGEELLAQAAGKLSAGGQPPAGGPCTLRVDVQGIAEKLRQMFEHPLWAEICRTCLNCGTCTYLCPTCQCFDIQSENRGEEGFKFRCWDSCMFPEYTQMAGGHNPRPSKKERVRNRFLHKLQYFPERYEKLGCVGCGRCLVKCPVGLDITRLIGQIQEVKLDA